MNDLKKKIQRRCPSRIWIQGAASSHGVHNPQIDEQEEDYSARGRQCFGCHAGGGNQTLFP